jgi:copper chaperone CopZ
MTTPIGLAVAVYHVLRRALGVQGLSLQTRYPPGVYWMVMGEIAYKVPGIHCDRCKRAVSSELEQVAGVEFVDVDLETKLVTVRGTDLDDAALRAAIDEAGYAAA